MRFLCEWWNCYVTSYTNVLSNSLNHRVHYEDPRSMILQLYIDIITLYYIKIMGTWDYVWKWTLIQRLYKNNTVFNTEIQNISIITSALYTIIVTVLSIIIISLI